MKRSVLFTNINGTIAVAGSKSASQRSVACALLADGTSELSNATSCDDLEAALRAADALGAQIERDGDFIKITGGLSPRSSSLDCGEAGLSIRMFSPIAALLSEEMTLNAHGSLLKRPLSMIREPLVALGASVMLEGVMILDGPPVKVKGPIAGGSAVIDGSVSSQFLTGLLIALTQAKTPSRLSVTNLKSRPYVDMTIEMLERFGAKINNEKYETFIITPTALKPAKLTIEGDWSNASFIACAAAVAGSVELLNLREDSLQADKAVIDAIKRAGARVEFTGSSVRIERCELNAFEFDATDCPDLFPPLAALAARCEGTSKITGAGRLKHKESDRATALKEEFAKAGILIELDGDLMIIHGGTPIEATISSRGDHRIAMCAAQLFVGLNTTVIIEGSEAVAKSYPAYYDDIISLGAEVSGE